MEASGTPAPPARSSAFPSSPSALGVLVLGLLGAIVLIFAELSTVVSIDVLSTGTCEEIADPQVRDACSVSGIEQHGGALIVLGLLALAMAFGAARGSSRPAALALIGIAVIVVGLTVLRDIPATAETGLVGLRYEAAEAGAGRGLYLELAGAALCAAAGALSLTRSSR